MWDSSAADNRVELYMPSLPCKEDTRGSNMRIIEDLIMKLEYEELAPEHQFRDVPGFEATTGEYYEGSGEQNIANPSWDRLESDGTYFEDNLSSEGIVGSPISFAPTEQDVELPTYPHLIENNTARNIGAYVLSEYCISIG